MKKTICAERIDAARLVASRMLGIKPGHACEAVAAACGHNTHAALLAALRANEALPRTPDARRFRARLAELGHAPAAAQADAALGVSFGAVPKGAADRKAVAGLVELSGFLERARTETLADRPAACDLLLAMAPIPDPSVATMLVGKDTLAWNPDFVRALNMAEACFLLAAAALHRAASHPLRRGERDPALWGVACDYVVNDLLIGEGVGKLPMFGYHNCRYSSDMPAEDVYDRIAGETRCHGPQPAFSFGTWKSKAPGRPLTVAEVAGTSLGDNGGYDGFRPPEMEVFDEEFVFSRRTAHDLARHAAGPGNRRIARAASFGRHLASLVSGMPEAERARAIEKALGQVRDAYRDAFVDGLSSGQEPSRR